MSDILIRGMKMPESCEECVRKHKFFRELKCIDLPGMRNFGENKLYTSNRNPHCPIHKLPLHGDLIDRSELNNSFEPSDFDGEPYDNVYSAICIVNSMPIIVSSNKEAQDG